jgi:hypothetical protein
MRIVASTVFILLVSLAAVAQETSFKIADLGWISGCWRSVAAKNEPVSTERWTPLAGGMMMGVSQTVAGEKTVEFESMRIVQDGSDVFYIARPGENKEDTPFKLVKFGRQEATFENPEHDFPQRIIYRRQGTRMFARIEGMNQGKEMGMDYPMVKTRCE